MKTSLKNIRTVAVILAIFGIVSPQAAWASGSKTGTFASRSRSQSRQTIGSATGAGKVKFNEFTIKKPIDTASPAFFKSCAKGSHYKEAHITVRKAGGDPKSSGKPFLPSKNDTVSTTKSTSDQAPQESITINYGKVEWRY